MCVFIHSRCKAFFWFMSGAGALHEVVILSLGARCHDVDGFFVPKPA